MSEIDPRDCQHGKADTEQEVADAKRTGPASVPAGYALVPVEPTEEMKLAWVSHKSFDGCYKAMIAAAPTPPVSEDRKDAELFIYNPTPITSSRLNQLMIDSCVCGSLDADEYGRSVEAEVLRTVEFEISKIITDARSYNVLRNGDGWPAVFASSDDPEPLRGKYLDAAMQEDKP